MAKAVTYDFRSFVAGELKVKESLKKEHPLLFAAGLGTALTFGGYHPAFAAGAGDFIVSRVMDGFDPLIKLIQAFGYPVGFISMGAGMILVMMGQKNKGLALVKWAAIGYIGLQFVPGIMKILHQIGVLIGATQ